jgi:hypothetical protein
MPTVPRYDSPQVAATSLPTTGLNAPTMPDVAGRQAQQMGQAMQQFGGDVGRIANEIAQQANQSRIDDAMNQLVKARTDILVEALQLKGRNALERPDGKSLADEYTEKLQKVANQIIGTLGNDAQRQAFQHSAMQLQQHFYGTLSSHMVEQQKVFRMETQKATIDTAVNQGVLLWGDEGMRRQSLSAISKTIDQMAVDNGWDKTTKDAALAEAVSPLHVGIMKSMIQGGMASKAREYYDANSAGMTLQARANMQGVLKEAVDSQVAEEKADAIWAAIGPKGVNDPVRIFDMEQAMREQLKDNHDALKKGIDSLRQRAQALNAQQNEMKAQNVAMVWKLIDSGTPMRQVHRSDAWLSLTDTERHTLLKQLENESIARASHELTIMQRNERLKFMRNGDKFLTATDPDVLSKMSRAQVEAMRGDFGMEATQHLLAKWDTLQKPGKVVEARFDKEDFDQVADSLGLHPFAKDSSEDHKRALGTLKYRIEQLIDLQQRELKRPLDRQEKMNLMRQEMAKTVTVDPGWYRPNQTVPVVQLSADQLKNVVVPPTDRASISEALKTMNARYPNNPLYFPTEDNVRRLYVKKISPAGGLIQNGK